jgi:acetyltransferase-like isoleucine patch superfamily enzyme
MLSQLKIQSLSKIKVKYFFFFFKLFFYKVVLRERLSLSSFNVSLEKGANLTVDKDSKLKFGLKGYISRLSNLESYDGALLDIGDQVFVNKNCSFVTRYGLKIGDNCQFGPNVCIYDHSHEFKKLGLIKDQGFYGKKIVIGDNVWVGAGSFIGAGVVIGDNSVIGSNTVVTKDVPADTVVYAVQKIEMRSFIKC